MHRWVLPSIILLGCATVIAACGSEDVSRETGDEDPDGSPGSGDAASSSEGDASTGPPPSSTSTPGLPMVECGDPPVECPQRFGAIRSCCTPDDACGVTSPVSADSCLEENQPGGVDLSCPEVMVDTLGSLPGCCTPDGECGGLDSESGLGCVANAELGAPEASCSYDPDNDCTAILPKECDGPEDCASGEMCCAQFNGSTYLRIACLPSCTPEAGGQYFEVCHAEGTCSDPSATCKESQFFPGQGTILQICESDSDPDATEPDPGPDRVLCGDLVCEAGERCCIPTPGEPSCQPEDQPCSCTGKAPVEPDAGSTDGGTSADASSDAATD